MNVYGISIPGLPGVVFGFNERIAWGMTNAASDVFDWYQITFRDSQYSAYCYEGKWRPTRKRVEKIDIRGGSSVLDTVIYTHYGPVSYLKGEKPFSPNIPVNAAMRWTAHDPSNEFQSLFGIDRAGNYQEFVASLNLYDNPAQNFAYADADGNIAIWHAGKFPLRWKGQGRYLSDGADSRYAWQGWIPRQHLPYALNPKQGFLTSANQHPTDPSYPYYLGWNYAPTSRALRINAVLRNASNITVADMQKLQLDDYNWFASKLLPALLKQLNIGHFSETEQKALKILRSWDYRNQSSLIAPTIFERWWQRLNDLIWKDEAERVNGIFRRPSRDVTLKLILTEPQNAHFDLPETDWKETIADLANQAFQDALRSLKKDLGPIGERWQWGRARGTNIYHLARIPAFSRLHLPTSGNYGIINATTRIGGPSWRMIVELGNPPRAWGIYPGGQSGNPGSAFYDISVDDWVEGKYYRLLFLKKIEPNLPEIVGTTILRGRPQ